MLRRVSKQLICPRCEDVVADAEYWPLAARLTITSIQGDQLTPGGWALQLCRAEQEVFSAAAEGLDEAQARLEFLRRHVGEPIYDIRCRRGHSTLRTGPQITRVLRRTPGRWVSLG